MRAVDVGPLHVWVRSDLSLKERLQRDHPRKKSLGTF
jgi:hypothetical protein